MDIVWEEPPQRVLQGIRRSQYSDFSEALRNNPERWARLPGASRTPKGAQGTAANIRRGAMRDFCPKGAFEAVTDDVTIYVRFVGASDETDPRPDEAPGDPAPPESSRSSNTADGDDLSEATASTVRAWARNNGFNVPDRGRLPSHLVEAYRVAHGLAGDSAHLRAVGTSEES